MQPVTHKRWKIREADEVAVAAIAAGQSLPPAAARILVNRGIDSVATAAAYLKPSLAGLAEPLLLPDMARAVARLSAARIAGETVCVYGDYDVDGISAVALLISFFHAVGIPCFHHIPLRLEHGYGLSAEALSAVAAHGASVVVSVDCGVTAVHEARHAADIGIDLIITDHHTPGETLPEAYAVINPLLPDSEYPFAGLSGVGVAFNLLVALRRRLRDDGVFVSLPEPDLRDFLDLVALGTVADLVPLREQNRILVKAGLKIIESSRRPGIVALKEVSGVSGEVNCSAVGFRLAPRLNAAGRLEDAALCVDLLLTDDLSRARIIAAELDAHNTERQALEKEILQSARQLIAGNASMSGRSSIVLASNDWHQGVIGIVASRLVELYHRPTVLIALEDGVGKGSGRSIPGFHLYQALNSCTEHLIKFGGHRQAAGLAIDESSLDAFVTQFEAVAAGCLTASDLVPELLLDGELNPGEVTLDLAQCIETLQPFGMGNPEPLFLLSNMRVRESRVLKGAHVKLVLEAGGCKIDAIAFGMADRHLPECIDAAVQVQLNVWNGRTSLQLQIKDFRGAA